MAKRIDDITTAWLPDGNTIRPVLAAVIRRGNTLLLCKRPLHKRHGGLWEFPGGKLEPGESFGDAARRELLEELNVEVIDAGPILFRRIDAGSTFEIVFAFVEIRGEPVAMEHDDLKWLDIRDAQLQDLAPSDKLFMEWLIMQETDVANYETQVSTAMKRLYGLTWSDASGDTEVLARALREGREPEEFVRWFGHRYDLDRVDQKWF